MPYLDPPSKTFADRLMDDPDLWNDYVKGNVGALYDEHVDLDAEVHGLPAGVSPIGCSTAGGLLMQTFVYRKKDDAQPPVARWQSISLTFGQAYKINPKVFVGILLPSAGDNILRVGAVTPTTVDILWICDWNTFATLYIVAIGEPYSAEDQSDRAWNEPKTWEDGEIFTYPDWNSYVRDDPNFLYNRHALQSAAVHGLGIGVGSNAFHNVLGASAPGQQMDVQRDPPGDRGTQEVADPFISAFTFTRAFASEPAVVTSAEFPGTANYQAIYGLSAAGVTTYHTGQTQAWYSSILAVGAD